MSTKMTRHSANDLIKRLPRNVRNIILEKSTLVEVRIGEILCEAGQPYKYVYYPLVGFISLVHTKGRHEPMEMRLIGSEGMLGVSLILGINVAPMSAIVQGAGSLLRITATQFRRMLTNYPQLKRICNRYLYILIIQLSQNAACIQFHNIDPRLARWLLMTHDRAHSDKFQLTHLFLSYMLGVRRSSITSAASRLQQDNLIQYTRGKIEVINRRGLESASCDCYKTQVSTYLTWLAIN